MLVSVPLVAADAVRRVPYSCWLGAGDDPNGFPNYGRLVDATGAPVETLGEAAGVAWDGQFGALTARLLAAVGADPTLVPADASGLDRETLIGLYPAALEPPDPEVP